MQIKSWVLRRFNIRVEVNLITGCWIWTGGKIPRGYGSFWDGERRMLAHKFAYESVHGPVPYGLELDHLCRNHACVNPAHLEAVTHKENTQRGKAGWNYKERTHCNYNHPFDDKNTGYRKDGGGRYCKICKSRPVKKIS